MEVLNANGVRQGQLHAGASAYVKLTWTIRHLHGATTLTIERRYLVPHGTRWAQLYKAHQAVKAINGAASQESPFFAPLHEPRLEISVRIFFLGRWSAPKRVTIRVR